MPKMLTRETPQTTNSTPVAVSLLLVEENNTEIEEMMMELVYMENHITLTELSTQV
jgi:hypothetical protein